MMRDDARPEDAALAALTSFRGALGRLNSAVCAKIAAAEYARPESARRRVGAYVHEITLADYGIKERPSYNAVFLSLFMAWYYPKSRSKPSRYSSENDVLIEKSVKYTDFFLLSIVYV